MLIIVGNILEAFFQDFYIDKPRKLCAILTFSPPMGQTEIYGLLWEFVATQGRKTFFYYFHLGTGL